MSRIACAWIPRFELRLAAAAEPDLWGRPAAIAGGTTTAPTRAVLIREVTPAAAAAGVRPGLPALQARALCPGLELRPPSAELRGEGETRVLRALGALAPQLAVDPARPGAFFLGLAGMRRLVGEGADAEAAFAGRIRAALAGCGFDEVSIGFADRPFTAWLAAERTHADAARPARSVAAGSARSVAAGEDGRFLADVPLAALGAKLPGPASELLSLVGLGTAGDVARALPPGALGRRFGRAGTELDRLCRGEDARVRDAAPSPSSAGLVAAPEEAALELDEPISDLEPVLFLFKTLIDRLLARLHGQRACLAELGLHARLDDRSTLEHVIVPAEPTLEARVLMDLVRLWLDAHPFPDPIRAMRLTALRLSPASARQLGLYSRREDTGQAALEQAVARLRAVFGEDAVVRPTLADSRRPEERLVWVKSLPPPTPPRPPARPPATTRLFARPRPARLERRSAAARPAYALHVDGAAPRRVARIEVEQRLVAEWWEDAPVDRLYAWIVCESGERFWVYHDRERGAVFVHAAAD